MNDTEQTTDVPHGNYKTLFLRKCNTIITYPLFIEISEQSMKFGTNKFYVEECRKI